MKYVDDSQPETQDKQLFGMLEDLCEIFSHLMVQVEWGFVVLAHPLGLDLAHGLSHSKLHKFDAGRDVVLVPIVRKRASMISQS